MKKSSIQIVDKERYLFIDVLKIFAIFLVVALHTGLWNTNFIVGNSISITNLIQYSFRLIYEGVPLFMFINGFLIMNKKFDLKKHMKKILKISIIFLIWSVLLPIMIKINDGEKIVFIDIMKIVLNTKLGSSYTGALWFLQKLIIIYLFFPVIKSLYDKEYKIYKYLLLTLSISTYGFEFLQTLFQLNIFNGIEITSQILPFFNQFTVYITDNIYLIYFMLGGYVYKNKEEFKKNKYILFGIIATLITPIYGVTSTIVTNNLFYDNYNYDSITLAITIIGLYALSNRIKIKNNILNRFISSLGENTMGIYLLHVFFISVANKFVNISTMNFVGRLSIVILIIMASWITTLIIRKIPKLSYIIKI